MNRLDSWVESFSRKLATSFSRRSFVAQMGRWLLGGALLPLLPVARANPSSASMDPGDPTSCDYWRYCAIDGYLCSCCGGTPSTCPPGSVPSPTAWVGTCLNPADGRRYIIAYRDCCGLSSCGRCPCLRLEGEMPAYRPQLNNDTVWCFGAPNMVYHCSAAAIVGVAEG